jgi:hypothetical protein
MLYFVFNFRYSSTASLSDGKYDHAFLHFTFIWIDASNDKVTGLSSLTVLNKSGLVPMQKLKPTIKTDKSRWSILIYFFADFKSLENKLCFLDY